MAWIWKYCDVIMIEQKQFLNVNYLFVDFSLFRICMKDIFGRLLIIDDIFLFINRIKWLAIAFLFLYFYSINLKKLGIIFHRESNQHFAFFSFDSNNVWEKLKRKSFEKEINWNKQTSIWLYISPLCQYISLFYWKRKTFKHSHILLPSGNLTMNYILCVLLKIFCFFLLLGARHQHTC